MDKKKAGQRKREMTVTEGKTTKRKEKENHDSIKLLDVNRKGARSKEGT